MAAWTVVATLVFPISIALWLGFAGALAYCGLSLGALTLHEVTTDRVVHHLRVGDRIGAERPAAHVHAGG